MSAYRHEAVGRLETFVTQMFDRAKKVDPMMRALMVGFGGQIPLMFRALDDNEDLLNEIMGGLAWVLGFEPAAEAPELEAATESIETPQDEAGGVPEEGDGTEVFGPAPLSENVDGIEPFADDTGPAEEP